MVARGRHLDADLAGELVPSDDTVLLEEPAATDGRAIQPLVDDVLDDVAKESLHRIGRKNGRLREPHLEVVDDGRAVPHEGSVRSLHRRDPTRPPGGQDDGVHPTEPAQHPRDRLVVEVRPSACG